MIALRQLSAVYIATAGAYAVAMALSAHPVWEKKAENAATFLRNHGAATAVAIDERVLHPGWVFAKREGRALGERISASFRSPPVPVAQRAVPKTVSRSPVPQAAAPARQGEHSTAVVSREAPRSVPTQNPRASSPLRGNENERSDDVAAVQPPPHAYSLAPQSASPAPSSTASIAPAPGSAEIAAVEQRLKDNLTSELFANFELFLYVSKADAGPWAQRMYVFQKQASGDLVLLYNWPVSTGREQVEFNPAGHRLLTTTPQGYYELDPNRSYAHYRSSEWGQPMPYAMFFNWVRNGDQTGLAIHAASGDDVARLGQRASAGCVHLSEDNARVLFTMIRAQYRGLAPRFAVNRRTGTMSNEGILLHDRSGNVQMAEGYKVLVFIEDYGGQNVVAALF